MKTRDIKKALRTASPAAAEFDPGVAVSLGSVPLNLACSGRTTGALPKGVPLWMIGHSSTGKSWLKNIVFAEANRSKEFDGYRFIDDNAERGSLMDVAGFFGPETAARIEPPMGTKERPQYSTTVQSLYYNIDRAFKAGKPFIYVVDSTDALTAEGEDKAFDKKAAKHGAPKGGKEDEKGSYNMEKPKVHSANLRRVCNRLMDTGSILVLISQTRANIGFDATFNPDTVAGGKALEFHCRLVFWMSIRERLRKRVLGKEREVGAVVQCKVTKNHVCGWKGKTEFVFFDSTGVDYVGSMVRYLIEEGHWKASGGEEGRGLLKKKVTAPEFDQTLPFNDLVEYIEENGLEKQVRLIVKNVWSKILEGSAVKRKRRYS